VDGSSVTINGSGVISLNAGLSGSVTFKGGWDASTNTPTLVNGTGTSGWMYIVTTAGVRNLGTNVTAYSVSDLLIYDGSAWIQVAANNGVVSFNTRTGAVTLNSSDVTTALGFTPYNATNPNSYLTTITSGQVTGALGYTPIQTSSLSVTTNSASGGGSLSYTGGVFTFTPYSLPSATTTSLGGVKVDNNTIVINNDTISVSSALTNAVQFKGGWDASSNTPTLGSGLPAGVAAGWEYIVSTAGTQNIGSGSIAYSANDLVIYNGTAWIRIPGSTSVVSFNTRQGAVTLTSSDVTTALGVQNANKVLAGPSTGADAAPTFRALVAADIPTLSTYATLLGVETLNNKTLGATTIAGSLIPNADVTYDLGSATYRFKDLYLSGSSIKLGSATITASGSALALPASSTMTTPIVGTNITTGSTSFDLINTTATTVNFAGAATSALKIGASTAPITGFAATATSTSTAASLGYLGMPQNSQSGSTYTVLVGDAGKHLYFTAATCTATIPNNSTTPFPVGTTIAFIASSATTLTIAIQSSDTMYLGGTGTTGSRTLAAYGMATAVKVTSTTWFINGAGLT
jgi:hypothetical protein